MLTTIKLLGALIALIFLSACDPQSQYEPGGKVEGLIATGPTGGTSPERLGLTMSPNATVKVEFYGPLMQPARSLGRCQVHEISGTTRNRIKVYMSGESGIPGWYYYSIDRNRVAKVRLSNWCFPERNIKPPQVTFSIKVTIIEPELYPAR